jgi:hypothetical protein
MPIAWSVLHHPRTSAALEAHRSSGAGQGGPRSSSARSRLRAFDARPISSGWNCLRRQALPHLGLAQLAPSSILSPST